MTNQHVVTKPKVLSPLGFVPGLRGRDRMALVRIQQALAAHQPVVSVVFNSGEAGEETVKAEVLCQDEDGADLAVLQVASPGRGPLGSSEFQQAIQPSETMPVFILGFPFGETLAAAKANPSITIGRAVGLEHPQGQGRQRRRRSRSTARPKPGNSQGPVVGARRAT